MSNRIYYSEEARATAVQQKIAVTTLATVLGILAGVMIALFWGKTLQEKSEEYSDSLSDLVARGTEMTQGVKEAVASNAAQLKEAVSEQISTT